MASQPKSRRPVTSSGWTCSTIGASFDTVIQRASDRRSPSQPGSGDDCSCAPAGPNVADATSAQQATETRCTVTSSVFRTVTVMGNVTRSPPPPAPRRTPPSRPASQRRWTLSSSPREPRTTPSRTSSRPLSASSQAALPPQSWWTRRRPQKSSLPLDHRRDRTHTRSSTPPRHSRRKGPAACSIFARCDSRGCPLVIPPEVEPSPLPIYGRRPRIGSCAPRRRGYASTVRHARPPLRARLAIAVPALPSSPPS